MNDCHRDPKPRQYHLSGSRGILYILNMFQIPIHTNRAIIFHSTISHLKVIPLINRKNHIIKLNIWPDVPYSNGTTSILVKSLTVIEILHRIRWFTRRNQNCVPVTLYGSCPQTPTPRTILIKQELGPHRHNK